MSKQYLIKLNGELIPVSEAVYRAYQRPKWREKKQKKVRKELECSYDAMIENGLEYLADPTQLGVDEIIADKLLIEALPEVLAALNSDEREMIYAMFYKSKSERTYAKESGIPRKTLAYRQEKVLEKLKNIFEKI